MEESEAFSQILGCSRSKPPESAAAAASGAGFEVPLPRVTTGDAAGTRPEPPRLASARDGRPADEALAPKAVSKKRAPAAFEEEDDDRIGSLLTQSRGRGDDASRLLADEKDTSLPGWRAGIKALRHKKGGVADLFSKHKKR
jgi:hypothetical protein